MKPKETAANSAHEIPSIEVDRGRTEVANADRFLALHGDNVRYVGSWKKIMTFGGKRWEIDDARRAELWAHDVSRDLFSQLGDFGGGSTDQYRFCKKAASRAGIQNTVALARPKVAIHHEELNRDPWLLNCLNGTLDLRTGELRPHDRRDLITQLAGTHFDEEAKCPLWTAFLDRIMDGDIELVDYLQRLVGYSLTGVIREHVLPIFHGCGANGKSTFINVIQGLLGPDYSMKAPHEMLMVRKHEPHPTEKATIYGRRLVAAVETEANKRIDEALIKELTGGDRITARRTYEDFWEFAPTHKLLMATNHKPLIRGTDEGIWRRLKLVPFEVAIPLEEQDSELTDKLLAELPGILNWAIEGCRRWQEFGLEDPPQVCLATRDYRGESDSIARFLESATIVGDAYSVKAGALYTEYVSWGGGLNQTAFGRELSGRGFEKKRRSTGWFYLGIKMAE